MMENSKELIKNTYLTLYGIIDKYKKENKKANAGALKHVNGIFASDLMIPVRKKMDPEYLSKFFFYEIMEIRVRFAQDRILTTELPAYILGLREKAKNGYYFDKLTKCYLSPLENGEATVDVFWHGKTEEAVIMLDEMAEAEEKLQSEKKKAGYVYDCITLPFQYVQLDSMFVLNQIADKMLKSARKYWSEVRENQKITDEKRKVEAYNDFYVSLNLYEIFLRKFPEETATEYEEYTRFLYTMQEDLEVLNGENPTMNQITEIADYYGKFSGKEFQMVENINEHVALYMASVLCVAFIELYNMKFYYEPALELISEKQAFPRNLLFEKNANDSYSIRKLAKEFVGKITEKKIFMDLPLHMGHDIVKKIFRFLDYIVEDKKASVHNGDAEAGRKSKLFKLAMELAYPFLERGDKVLVIREENE